MGADGSATDDLVQAVDESVTNVIRHGYQGMPGRLEVFVERRGPDLIVSIRDDAPTFDPTGHDVQDLEVPLTGRRLGGFGIHLTRISVDRVTHRGRTPTGNELRLTRRLDPPTQEQPT
jgi:anti-sigma regulatory factor (Ser/Thr protein kinase)